MAAHARTPLFRVADWYDAERRPDWSAERKLAAAVLECAMRDLSYPHHAACCRDAWAWVFADDDSHAYPFTFLNCCAVVGIDPEAFRARVRQGVRWGTRRQYPRDAA